MIKKRSRLTPSIRTKVSRRNIVFMTAATMLIIVSGLIVALNFNPQNVYAAVSGDFRSAASGNWSSISTWQTFNGSSWVAASATPNNLNGAISVQSGHTVTVTVNVDADQFVVDAGGTLIVNAGKTLTIQNGSGTDFTSNGTVSILGTIDHKGSSTSILAGTTTLQAGGANTYAASATITINSGGRFISKDATCTSAANIWTVNSGGIFQHDIDGGNLPMATWNSGSTCEVTGVTGSKPGNLDQSFYNFTWNCPNQTGVENLSGKLTSIAGDFSFMSSGTGKVMLGHGENYLMTIGGNYYHQGGNLFLTSKSLLCQMNITGNLIVTGGTIAGNNVAQDNGDGSPTVNVSGNFSISGGTFDFSQDNSSSTTKGITTFNLFGNFTQTGGSLTETATSTGRGDVNFKKSGTAYFSKTSGTANNLINYTVVSGTVVDVGTSVFTSSGSFTLESGGGLNMGSTAGIAQASAHGNVQVTGTRSFNTGADYIYNGSSAQVTGNGLPATVRNFTINNDRDVTLTNNFSVSSTLYLINGKIITSNNEISVTNTGSTAISGHSTRSYVIGSLRRSVNGSGIYDYPVGATFSYQLLTLTLSSTSGFSTIASEFVAGDPAPGGLRTPILKDGAAYSKMLNMGYWRLEPNSPLTSGSYGVALYGSGFSNTADASSTNPSDYVTFKRPSSGNDWDVMGTRDVSKQFVLAGQIVTYNGGYTTFSHFGQGTGGGTLPIKLMSFDADLNNGVVELNWKTAAEINNDYFTIERSTDGKKYTEILRQRGAGNSTQTLYYADKDETPSKGYNYYRLKQTDFDGHYSYSEVKTVRVKKTNASVPDMKIESAYPNPFSENFKINFTMNKSATVDVILMNVSGQVIAQEKFEAVDGLNTYEFNSQSELSKGIYFVTLIYNDQKEVQKLIKN